MSPIVLRPDDALTSKTVTVYTPPTCQRWYRSESAAYMRWARDLVLRGCEWFDEQGSRCALVNSGESLCAHCKKYDDDAPYRRVVKRLARWLKWRASRGT
jgi:hypothetical protein